MRNKTHKIPKGEKPKRNKALYAAAIIFCLMTLSMCLLSHTYAKYVSSDYSNNEARVAKFGMVTSISGTLFGAAYSDPDASSLMTQTSWTEDNDYVASAESSTPTTPATPDSDVVAPGTTGTQNISINGVPETSVRVNYGKAQDTSGNVYIDSEIYLVYPGSESFYGVMVESHETVNGEAALGFYTRAVDATTGNVTYTKITQDNATYAAGVTVYSCEDTAGTGFMSEDYYPIIWTLEYTESGKTKLLSGRLSEIKKRLELLNDETKSPNERFNFSDKLTWTWPFGTDKAATERDTILGYMISASKNAGEGKSFKNVVLVGSDGVARTITYKTEPAGTGAANNVVNAYADTQKVACLTEAFSQRIAVEQIIGANWAVYTDDGTLSFDYFAEDPVVGTTKYNGQTITAAYSLTEANWDKNHKWSEKSGTTTTVNFVRPVQPTTTANWFGSLRTSSYIFGKLAEVKNASNLDTSQVTSMDEMFEQCAALKSIDVSNWDVSACTSFDRTFENCISLETLDVSKWKLNTTKDVNLSALFSICSSLKEIDVSAWDTSTVTSTWALFRSCSSLTMVDLSSWYCPKNTSVFRMFENCTALKTIYASVETVPVAKSGWNPIFRNCKAIVGGAGTTFIGEDYNYATIDGSYITYTGATSTEKQKGYFTLHDSNWAVLTENDTTGEYTLSFIYAKDDDNEPETYRGKTVIGAWKPNEWVVSADASGNLSGAWSEKMADITTVTFDALTNPVDTTANWFRGATKLTDVLKPMNFDTSRVKNMSRMFNNCSSLTSLDASTWDTSNVTNMSNMFSNCRALTSLNVSTWDVSNVTTCSFIFDSCSTLETLDLTNWKLTGALTDDGATRMFKQMSKLKSLTAPNLITSTCTNLCYMFNSCHALTELDICGWDTSNVTNTQGMFVWCEYLKTVYVGDSWSMDKVTKSTDMFSNCSSLSGKNYGGVSFGDKGTIDATYAKAPDGYLTFHDANWAVVTQNDDGSTYTLSFIYSEDAETAPTSYKGKTILASYKPSEWNVSWKNKSGAWFGYSPNTTAVNFDAMVVAPSSMQAWFAMMNITTLTNPERLDTSNVTSMTHMFEESKIQTLDANSWNVSNVTTMQGMFYGCKNLTSVAVDKWNTSNNLKSVHQIFSGCSSLTAVNVARWNVSGVNIENGMFGTFSQCKNLTEVDLSGWDTSNVTSMLQMFAGDSSLETVYVGENWSTESLTNDTSMFQACNNLSGKNYNGVSFADKGNVDKTYAKAPDGYLTFRDANWAVYTDDGTLTFTYFIDDPVVGTTTLGDQTITAAYSLTEANWDSKHKWTEKKTAIKTVNFARPVHPTTTSSWFNGATSLVNVNNTEFLDMANVSNTSYMFDSCTALIGLDVSTFDTSNVTNMTHMFNKCSALKTVDVSNWNTSKVTDMSMLFSYDTKLTTITGIGNWDTSNVVNMYGAFYSCGSLTDIDVSNWNTSKVTNFGDMFRLCSVLTSLDVSKWNTSSAKSLYGTFKACKKLTTLDVSNWDTSNVTSMDQTFEDCYVLNSLDVSNWDTSKVTTMANMFHLCAKLTSLDTSNWNTSNVTTMASMFSEASALKSLDTSNWNTSNVTTMAHMFRATYLTEIDLSGFNTSKLTDTSYMFEHNGSLTTIYVGDNWDMSKVSNSGNMFGDNTNLTGGQGTTFDSSAALDKTRAHVDGGTDDPGYLTYKSKE